MRPAPQGLARADDFERVFDRFFGEFPFLAPERETKTTWMPSLDFSETEKEYVVRIEAAGIAKEDLELNLEGQVLTVAGRRTFEQVENSEDFFWRERETGRFLRAVRLPTPVKPDAIDARYNDGVLTIRLQKMAPSLKSRITVK
jgi:HSP20 family protein